MTLIGVGPPDDGGQWREFVRENFEDYAPDDHVRRTAVDQIVARARGVRSRYEAQQLWVEFCEFMPTCSAHFEPGFYIQVCDPDPTSGPESRLWTAPWEEAAYVAMREATRPAFEKREDVAGPE
jgi:hypothetical protein